MKTSDAKQIAIKLAREYGWAGKAEYIENHGRPPIGFGREVGETIALFLATPPLGGLLQSRESYENERANDRAVASKLCRLRVAIAKLNRKA